MPVLRHLALERAVYWFGVEKHRRQVKILVVFFGGQDHQRHMLVRLLQGGGAWAWWLAVQRLAG